MVVVGNAAPEGKTSEENRVENHSGKTHIAPQLVCQVAHPCDVPALLDGVGAPPAAILPFTWYRYHPGTAGKYGGQYISAHDAWLEFDYPFNAKTGLNTTGVIVWGYEPKPAEAATAEAWFEQQAPYFVNATPPAP